MGTYYETKNEKEANEQDINDTLFQEVFNWIN